MLGADWQIGLAIFAGTLISRLPFRTTLLYAWDSVLYTRAIENFNINLEQPQPPGHIFYVALIWLVNRLIGDPNASMVWISIFSAAAAAAVLYWLGNMMFDRTTGLLAALLLATSLSFWANSEVAYPYTLLGLLSIICAAAIYKVWQGNVAWALPSALILGAASGFREDLLFFLTPLLALALWRHGKWRMAGAAVIIVLMVALWYIPSALLSGGVTLYRQASGAQTSYIFKYYSIFGRGFKGLEINILTTARFMLMGLAAAAPMFAVFILGLSSRLMKPVRRDRRLLFLVAWSAPSFLFYIFIHIGDYGYIFTFLPAALLAAAWGLKLLTPAAARKIKKSNVQALFALAGTALVAANVLLFLTVPTPLSASRIVARDQILRCRIETIRRFFDPETTFIISVYDYQQASYYLPEYKIWNFDPVIDEHPRMPLPDKTREIVIFDEYLHPFNADRAKTVDICRDQVLEYFDKGQSRAITVDWKRRKIGL